MAWFPRRRDAGRLVPGSRPITSTGAGWPCSGCSPRAGSRTAPSRALQTPGGDTGHIGVARCWVRHAMCAGANQSNEIGSHGVC